MKLSQFILSGACVILADSSIATTLDFEDLNPSPAAFDILPTPYNGLTFSGWYAGPDTVYSAASGTIDLFTDFADPSDPFAYIVSEGNSIRAPSPIIFDGAYFSGYSGVTFRLLLSGALVWTSLSLSDAPGPDPYGPTFLASGYAALVDEVIVSGVQGFFSMDDFTFRRPTLESQVPTPSTVLLLIGAFAVLGIRSTGRLNRAVAI